LAHTLDDKTEEAYRRTDMIEKRRRLMTAWAEFCGKAPVEGNVIELPTAQRAMALREGAPPAHAPSHRSSPPRCFAGRRPSGASFAIK
jgi:hypothetical protein